jgi:uncharacterized membrane protein
MPAIAPASQRRQKGAISILAAVSIAVVMGIAALTVDIGHTFVVRRDLQKAADLSSLSALSDMDNATAVAQNIALTNNADLTAENVTVVTGIYNWGTRTFAASGSADGLNSVRVTVGTDVDYFFRPGSVHVEATATAAREATAGISAGSFLARLDTIDSALLNGVLGDMLGSAVSLDLASYQGLAAGSVTLAGLQAALGLGTLDEVLNANRSLADLLDASITALNAQGDAASRNAADILDPLLAAIDPALNLRLGDLLKVDTSNPTAAAQAEINLLQMMLLGAEIANGSNLINLPLAVSVPGVASINLAMTMVEPPAIDIGPARRDESGEWMTQAHSAQIRLRLRLTLLDAVSGGLVNIPVYIEGGAVDAALTGIQCKVPRDDSVVTVQTQPQLLSAYIGEVSDTAMQNTSVPVTVTEATLLNVLGIVRVGGYASVPLESPPQELYFNGPFDQDNKQTTAGSGLGIGGLLDSNLALNTYLLGLPLLVGPLVTPIVNTLLGLLGGVLGPVLDGLLDQLLSILGVSLGGADITAYQLNCGAMQLVR